MWHVWGKGEVHAKFWVGNLRERDRLEDTGVDGRIVFKCIFRKLDGNVDWINGAQKRDKRRALVNTVMNRGGFHKMR